MLLSELGLQAAPATAVASDDDLAFHVDATACELLVIVGHAVVDVHEFAGDVAIRAIDVVRRQAVAARGGGIALDRRLVQSRGELVGSTSSSVALFGVGYST